MEKRNFAPNKFGYITNWLVSGPLETPIDPATRTIADQNQYEAFMKKNSHDDDVKTTPDNISVGAPGLAGMPWRYYHAGENYFVDCSRFYFTMHKCEFWAASVLVSPRDQQIELDIRSYTALDVWVGGEHVFCEPICAYRPMRRARVAVTLKAGENMLFIRLQNSCTRDTRNIAAVQIVGNPDVTVQYPGEETEELRQMQDAAAWLASLQYDGKSALSAVSAPVFPVRFNQPSLKDKVWTEGKCWEIGRGVQSMLPYIQIGETKLERKLEMWDRILPRFESPAEDIKACRDAYLRRIAETPAPENPGPNGNWFYETYARLALGYPFTEGDKKIISAACVDALEHHDCSDFRLCYMLKALRQGLPIPADSAEEIYKATVDYSFWSDEPAVGAMCYGSENHALLFHSTQMMAGQLWPDTVFTRTGRTGREQEAIARERIEKWIANIEKRGFGEFLSGGYTVITVVAMLAVYDCAGGELTERIGKLIDKVFYDLALNSYDDLVCAPQGRIYRSVLNPWTNSTESLYYFATGRGVATGCNWMAAFAKTGYEIPDDVYEKATAPGMTSYFTAGTKVQTYKSKGFMMTSLPLPIVGEGAPGPFIPGGSGYQQHLYYCCLGGAANVFAHHPGGTHDGTQIRPGYWYGNGYMPAVRQDDNVIGALYRLDRDHPVPFVHMFFPEFAFDEVIRESGWIFGRKGSSYIAVWCSRELTLHNRDITQNVDFRAEGGSSAWLFVCGDETVSPDFASFMEYAKAKAPAFDEAEMRFTYGSCELNYGADAKGREIW